MYRIVFLKINKAFLNFLSLGLLSLKYIIYTLFELYLVFYLAKIYYEPILYNILHFHYIIQHNIRKQELNYFHPALGKFELFGNIENINLK